MPSLKLWTDGSVLGNPGPGGWAYVLVNPQGANRQASGHEPETTNNRMELQAVIEGLSSLAHRCPVTVVTDSQYVSNPFVLGWLDEWKAKGWARGKNGQGKLENADLWKRLDAEVSARPVFWRDVRGHSGWAFNELADRLAGEAAKRAAASRGVVRESERRERTEWWLTIAGAGSNCRDCGIRIVRGDEIVYRHSTATTICVACSEERRIDPVPSKRWRAALQDRRVSLR